MQQGNTMVKQYILGGFDTMEAVDDGAYVSVDDYTDLEERHDTFLKDVRRVFDDLSCAANSVFDADTTITDAVDNLEAAFMADAHPQDAR